MRTKNPEPSESGLECEGQAMGSVSNTENGTGTWSEDVKPPGSQSCWDSAAHRSDMSFLGPCLQTHCKVSSASEQLSSH